MVCDPVASVFGKVPPDRMFARNIAITEFIAGQVGHRLRFGVLVANSAIRTGQPGNNTARGRSSNLYGYGLLVPSLDGFADCGNDCAGSNFGAHPKREKIQWD
jgi:hypothetical protein